MKLFSIYFSLLFLGIISVSNSALSQNERQKATQVVMGRITDSEANSPLAGVKLTVVLDSNKLLVAYSDKNGFFKIKNVPIGRQSLKVSRIGYEEQKLNDIIVTAGKEVSLNISLVEKISKADEVVVTYDRAGAKINAVNEYATVSARAFNLDETKKYAGALGDPSRMAQNFAGVIGANDSRNDIVVRGNSPAGMLWVLEGINIPNPNHFGSLGSTGGPVSLINNNNLDKSDFFTGAFPAQYGNAFAGAFDLSLRNGNRNKNEFIAQIGFNGFEFGAEGPLYEELGGSYLVNYRYSTLGVFKQMGINFGTGSSTPNYQDLNFKFNLPINDKSRFTLFGILGKSDIAFLGNEADTTKLNLYGNENENTIVDYSKGIVGTSFESNLSDNTFMKLTLGLSATDENFTGDSIDVNTRIAYKRGFAAFETQKFSLVGQLRHKFDAKNSMAFGFNIDRTNFQLKRSEFFNAATVEAVRVNIDENSLLSQAYVQFKHKFTDELNLITGIHTQHYDLGNAFAVEPRASLQYFIDGTQSISLGYGLHSQAQNIYDYFVQTQTPNGVVYTNKNLDFTKSHHLVLSYDYNFAKDWRLKTEAYYQSLYNIPISQNKQTFSLINSGNSFAPNDETNLINEGTATNYGLELTLEKFFSDGFYVLATTSVFDSKYKGYDKIERNTAFNTNYVVNLLAGKEWKIGDDVLTFSVKLSSTGGRYLTPLDFAASSQTKNAVYDDSRAFSERQSAYFRMDVKIGYRIEYGSSTMEFSIDLQNATNNDNVFAQSYNRRTNSIITQLQQGFFPVPTFRYTF